ncbi:type II secretion system F family protein [Oscillibacter sp.]|uniref:type II secretion system F family protein n=1 Tax=Oscillibacter sp. TaxID=1945593 RepID=UPI003393E476
MMNKLSNDQISTLCMELALMLHAGISADDGLHLMLEDQTAGGDRSVVEFLSAAVDGGTPLARAMADSGAFPAYVTGLVEVGFRTGRLEEALDALSGYYNDRARLETQVRSALLYPALLMLLMVVVVVVLLAKVLPVFDQVFRSLGGSMTGVAGGLLQVGLWLDGALPVLCALLALAALAIAAFAASDSFRDRCLRRWKVRHATAGITGKLTSARMAQALSMGLRSGLPMEESLDMAALLLADVPAAQKRCQDCRAKMEVGAPLAEALKETGAFPPVYCRMLALGARSGSADTVMEEIAHRLSDDGETALQTQVGRVEPVLTIVGSLLVGIILLSAMLPLLNILSAIG